MSLATSDDPKDIVIQKTNLYIQRLLKARTLHAEAMLLKGRPNIRKYYEECRDNTTIVGGYLEHLSKRGELDIDQDFDQATRETFRSIYQLSPYLGKMVSVVPVPKAVVIEKPKATVPIKPKDEPAKPPNPSGWWRDEIRAWKKYYKETGTLPALSTFIKGRTGKKIRSNIYRFFVDKVDQGLIADGLADFLDEHYNDGKGYKYDGVYYHFR